MHDGVSLEEPQAKPCESDMVHPFKQASVYHQALRGYSIDVSMRKLQICTGTSHQFVGGPTMGHTWSNTSLKKKKCKCYNK